MQFSAAARGETEGEDTPLHHMDARVKLAMILALIVGVLVTPDGAWPAYPLVWAILAVLGALARIRAARLARLGAVALPFALAALTLLFTTPGQPIFRVLGLTATDAGAVRFISIVLKSWLAAQAAVLLSLTTAFTDVLWALRSFGLPATLIMITAFMYRYLFTIREEAERLLRARASRSARPNAGRGEQVGGTLLWRARVAGTMVGSLFLRSYERSERVYSAMLARGFSGQFRAVAVPRLTPRSIAGGVLPVFAMIVVQVLTRLWWI